MRQHEGRVSRAAGVRGGHVSWAIGFDSRWNRDIGYGVPAYCDHPKCVALIDRGLSYVCGGEPYGGDRGCGLYFCSDHGGGDVCPRCANYKPPYKRVKPDHPKWVRHKLTDESWQQWRDENPSEVALLRSSLYFTLRQPDTRPRHDPRP